MVIGSGMLARLFDKFHNHPDVVIFASGVSNSCEKNPDAFKREQMLLESAVKLQKTIVYFSTTSIDDVLVNKNAYVHHKIAMENLIRSLAHKYHIFRLSQVLGNGGNPNTIINSIKAKILNSETIQVFANATRNIISSDDIQKIVCLLLEADRFSNQTLNIATPWDMPIEEIVDCLGQHLQKRPHIQLLDVGSPLTTPIQEISNLNYDFGAATGPAYLRKIFQIHLPLLQPQPFVE